ncbi:fork head domain-containing protein [Bisporella sp. PMI_857]|nr:fork head domain-containing protein [Bisporella sp. PMI_857]
MASTRFAPLEIYQDPADACDHAPMPSMQSFSSIKKPSPLRSLKNASTRRNLVLNPPQTGGVKRSPLKSNLQSSSSPLRAPFSSKLNSISMPPPGGSHHNTDSLQKKQPLMSKFKPQKSHFPIYPNVGQVDKENYTQPLYQQSYDGFPAGNFSLEGLYPRPAPKRTLMDAAPIQESRPIKRARVEETVEEEEALDQQQELPAPDSFPPLVDDGTKPSYSYAQLIGMSILRAPNRRLTLAQIYKWISDSFSFYHAAETGWQNSIRHNLSLNKAFIKQERPKDDPGKGNYWAIQPGMEHQFIKEKTTKKAGPNESVSILSANLALNEPEGPHKVIKPAQAAQDLPSQPAYAIPESQLPTHAELSSDATIPASDAFVTDNENEEHLPSSPLINSSPPAVMHSSPPVSRHIGRRQDTPPPVPRFPSSSRTRSRKRKFASMDDSGIKRGRAEEEIARLRGSSYDSPSKGRALSTFGIPSSSPFRRDPKPTSTQMLPPLTPALKLKAPLKAPPSASPNTNLQLHRDRVREMVGSPLRSVDILHDDLQPWDSYLSVDDAPLLYNDFSGGFNFLDNSGFLSVPGNGSPEKRSAKRPRLDRSKSANILADITNSNTKKDTVTTPKVKLQPSMGSSFFNSPLKGLGLLGSPSKQLNFDSPSKVGSPFNLAAFDLPAEDEFFGAEFLSEEINDFGGMDIMQGFQKIGANGQAARSTPKPDSARPSFARSFTSRF